MKRLRQTIISCLCIGICITTAAQTGSSTSVKLPSVANVSSQRLLNKCDTSFNIVVSGDHTYGYEIRIGDKIFIRQLTIPGQSGIKRFKNKIDAEKVARLVIKKLSLGIMPPTVYPQELDQLKIDY